MGHLLHKKGKKKGGDQTLTLAPPPPSFANRRSRRQSDPIDFFRCAASVIEVASSSIRSFEPKQIFVRAPLPSDVLQPNTAHRKASPVAAASVAQPSSATYTSRVISSETHADLRPQSIRTDPTRALLREPIVSRASAYSVAESHARRAFRAALHVRDAYRVVLHARAACPSHFLLSSRAA